MKGFIARHMPSGISRKIIENMLEEGLSTFSRMADVEIDNDERVIKIRCHLYGETEETIIRIHYNIWKEEDRNENYKRYVLHIKNIESSKEWLSIIVQKRIVGSHIVWYRKAKYWERVEVNREKVIWMRKLNGEKIRTKPANKIYYIPNDMIEHDGFRKAVYRALK